MNLKGFLYMLLFSFYLLSMLGVFMFGWNSFEIYQAIIDPTTPVDLGNIFFLIVSLCVMSVAWVIYLDSCDVSAELDMQLREKHLAPPIKTNKE